MYIEAVPNRNSPPAVLLRESYREAGRTRKRKLALPRLLLGRRRMGAARWRDLALAMIVNRVITPASKLATVRALAPETATSSLGTALELGQVEEREIYRALDWLGRQQERIERALARRHLGD